MQVGKYDAIDAYSYQVGVSSNRGIVMHQLPGIDLLGSVNHLCI